MNVGKSGALGEMIATMYFLEAGYEVFQNCTPNGPADLTVWNKESNVTVLVDVKHQRVGYKKKDGSISFAKKESFLRDDNVWVLVVNQGQIQIPPAFFYELNGIRNKDQN